MTIRTMSAKAAVMGVEALIVVAAYLLYSALRVVVEGGEGTAVDHAFRLISIERSVGLFHEAAVQQYVAGHPWLSGLMEVTYLWTYLPILVGAGLIMYLRNPGLYRAYRNTMFISAAIGLVIFALLPVAPPRMLHEFGFVDPLHTNLTATSSVKNDFAAVPSFHFGFTLLATIGVAHAFSFRRWLIVPLAAVPALMLMSIVSTANHFFLDAVAGGAVVMIVWAMVVGRREDGSLPAPFGRGLRVANR